MRVEWMLLANHAETPPNGLLYLSGAAWDTVDVAHEAPAGEPVAFVQGWLVVRLALHTSECDRPYEFRMAVVDEDGQEIAHYDGEVNVPSPLDQPVGWDVPGNILANLTGMPLPRFGLFTINLSINGEHKDSRPFRVRLASP